MKRLALMTLAVGSPILHAQQPPSARAEYFPSATTWERRSPAQVGMDSAKIQAAIAFALSHETPASRDLEEYLIRNQVGREPFNSLVGPVKPHGGVAGVIVRNGYIVAEFGDPARVDMTFSMTKSFVSAVVGVALDRGLIRSLDDLVQPYMAPILHATAPDLRAEGGQGNFGSRTTIEPFNTPHNRRITWRHLLHQTSAWEGTLWGKTDWGDRPSNSPATWLTAPRPDPGVANEYNDVRVNVAALAALNVWRRPLPEVLKEFVMDPIGASPTWRWYGYDNSWVVIDGKLMQSVSGGGHWGGGMFINAYDQARFALMTSRGGRWGKQQVLSERFISEGKVPVASSPLGIGFMNFTTNARKNWMPTQPPDLWMHAGNGLNAAVIDEAHDLIMVVRWIQQNELDGFVSRVRAAIIP